MIAIFQSLALTSWASSPSRQHRDFVSSFSNLPDLIQDPPRDGVKEAVMKCKDAGVKARNLQIYICCAIGFTILLFFLSGGTANVGIFKLSCRHNCGAEVIGRILQVVMVTGDHPTTARAIAKRVSILPEAAEENAHSFEVQGSGCHSHRTSSVHGDVFES